MQSFGAELRSAQNAMHAPNATGQSRLEAVLANMSDQRCDTAKAIILPTRLTQDSRGLGETRTS